MSNYFTFFLLKLLEGSNWAGVLFGPIFSNLRALSITFLSRPTDPRRSFKLWPGFHEPIIELHFNPTLNLESFQMPQQENFQEDTAVSLSSCLAILVEGSVTWTSALGSATLSLHQKGQFKSRTDRRPTNYKGNRKRHCSFYFEKTG